MFCEQHSNIPGPFTIKSYFCTLKIHYLALLNQQLSSEDNIIWRPIFAFLVHHTGVSAILHTDMDSKLSFEGFSTVNSLQNCFLHSKLETSLLCLGSAVCFRYVVRSLKKKKITWKGLTRREQNSGKTRKITRLLRANQMA